MFSWAVIFSLSITQLIFSSVGHIFHMFCQVHFHHNWNAEIWVHERIRLSQCFIMFHSTSDVLRSDYTISCVMAHSVAFHSDVLESNIHKRRLAVYASQVMWLNSALPYSILSLWLNKLNCWEGNRHKTWNQSTQKSHTNPHSTRK
jgi:hypothetical protein